ncbi:anthranilate synthase component I [Haloferax mediterranei ATCC 33500]|uniref:Anthranilate synthase component 1 n=1 Tax=Haloferax mediterranei (strain ATCC 33500 / DSM 1411 / JCM 8866 / NBRC 14739 / NCIMB 2177 / R-4) TaxID=523841 RepID=I3R7D8_HALMT|nr:anthranilate synthase component I [Haloferax mediterranei]AFK20148.1 anthranilate synthase, component I [Haloferax mediterranei ATCC 33500]AHZ23522.1 anthranilate synthase [Haloferax mediterranei ATCC 33500]ELZ99696.1 anthranilate synthase component I [Haloferax mediterranei ATCC 33500]MDX5987100.1 anthranilate synthase component I [Haloferax mediterranei ATCC 33500]QCQ76414.1 anthranilate synthase component I [Haloferax mediterranei ATCC 33500]
MTRPETDRDEFVELVANVDEQRSSACQTQSGDAERAVVTHLVSELDVDVDPLAAYTALADRSDYGFLLESAEKVSSSNPQGAFSSQTTTADSHARFSFVGYDPEAVVTVGPDGVDVTDLGGPAAEFVGEADGDVLDSLRGALPDLPRINFPETDRQTLTGGLVGFLAYEAVYDLWLDEVGRERPETDDPDAEFVLTTRTLAFDHREDTVRLVCTPVVTPDDDPGAVYDEVVAEAERVAEKLAAADDPSPGGFERTGEEAGSRESYEAAVRQTKEHVRDGDIYQGVLSRTRKLRGQIDPVGLYASLREVNPSPYMYLLRHGDRRVVGASPETLVSVGGDRVAVNPIAGTCQRGSGPVEDRRLAGELLADSKERSEHTMLVDLGRNDVRRVAKPGSVRVEDFMSIIKYSHVQHIESTVTGTVDDDSDAFDATRATFPAGTLTGAPKVRAMEIIDDLEDEPRGVYGGGVGYYSWTGDADMAIVIRTATVESDGNEDIITVRAGAGLVADSDPASEYDETEQKMGGVLDAIRRIEYKPTEVPR